MAEIRLKNVRLAFPSIFEPKAFDEKSKAKYQATFLVPKNSPLVAEIEKAIRAAAVAKWGPKADAMNLPIIVTFMKNIKGVTNTTFLHNCQIKFIRVNI